MYAFTIFTSCTLLYILLAVASVTVLPVRANTSDDAECIEPEGRCDTKSTTEYPEVIKFRRICRTDGFCYEFVTTNSTTNPEKLRLRYNQTDIGGVQCEDGVCWMGSVSGFSLVLSCL